jgi:septal ring factor EnvC (AmiA/AmiB activator)
MAAQSTGSPAPQSYKDPAPRATLTAQVAQLLVLLADASERADEHQAASERAEQRAEEALAETQAIRIEIQGLSETVTGLEAQIASYRASLRAADERVVELESGLAAERQQARHELDEIRRSTSWKVTKPLRAAGAVLRPPPGTGTDR